MGMLRSFPRLTRIVSMITLILMLLVPLLVITNVAAGSNSANILNSLKSSDVMDLLYGNEGWYVTHIYQGANGATPTSSWPVFYNGTEASQNYWGENGINQPILDLVPLQGTASGAMYWSEAYNGGNVTITLVGTYSTYSSGVADGFYIYMFINPTTWSITENYNYSIPFSSNNGLPIYSPVSGDVILPQSIKDYLFIQWDPLWQTGGSYSGASGQWNVWIVSNPNGSEATVNPTPSPTLGSGYYGWDGIGSGYFSPNPGDYIYIKVTYDPSTNTLTGIAIDLNTSETSSFTLNLNGYYNPPSQGVYVFGIGAATGADMANWGVLYVNYSSSVGYVHSTGSILPYLLIVVILVVVIVVIVTVIVLVKKRK